MAEKLTTIFLTKMNDKPQTKARNNSKIQEIRVLSSLFVIFFINLGVLTHKTTKILTLIIISFNLT
jgi:hypothetical protein